MSEEVQLHGWINPTILFSLEPLMPGVDAKPSAEAVLHDVCPPEVDASLDAMVKRCAEVAQARNPLGVVPSERNILTKLVWPLRNARACYVLGNYLGTIALCGMVAEMVAIAIFDVAEPIVDGHPLDRKRQVEQFGCRFERLGQKRRVEELKKLGIIAAPLVAAFETVQKVRRSYLHFWSHDHGAAGRDAASVYESTVAVVVAFMGIHFDNGRAVLTPAMVKYLKKRGLYQPVEPPEG